MWTTRAVAPGCTVQPVDDAPEGPPGHQTPGMAIEVVPAELYALAGVLDAGSVRAAQAGTAVDGAQVGGPLGAAVTGFCETVRTAGSCLSGELAWLGAAIAAAADSWSQLDGSLRPPRGTELAQ